MEEENRRERASALRGARASLRAPRRPEALRVNREPAMRHFLSTMDYSRAELELLLEKAARFKKHPIQGRLKDRTIALVFFNPSLRTRTSFDIGIRQLGGSAITLEPGKGSWPIEFEDGVVMDGEAEEHVHEVARVLSRYVDLIGVRAFPKFKRWEDDREDKVLAGFAKYATVPVINLETITHPCQELALALAMKERLGPLDGKKFVLTWTYHPKPLNTAVANSALLIASKLGLDVTLLCPNEQYHLDARYLDAAKRYTAENGRSLSISYDIDEAYKDASFVYAKSWGASPTLAGGMTRSPCATATSTSSSTRPRWQRRRMASSLTACRCGGT